MNILIIKVSIVSFTGSCEVGRTLYSLCGKSLKRVALELGGNAPFIIFRYNTPSAQLSVSSAVICSTLTKEIVGFSTLAKEIVGFSTLAKEIVGLSTLAKEIVGLSTLTKEIVGLSTLTKEIVGFSTLTKEIVGFSGSRVNKLESLLIQS